MGQTALFRVLFTVQSNRFQNQISWFQLGRSAAGPAVGSPGHQNQPEILDLGSGKSRLLPFDSDDTINWVTISWNAAWVAAVGYGKVYIWDTLGGKRLSQFEIGVRLIGNLAISPDGSEILIESNCQLSLYDVASQKMVRDLKCWEDGDLATSRIRGPLLSDKVRAHNQFIPGLMIGDSVAFRRASPEKMDACEGWSELQRNFVQSLVGWSSHIGTSKAKGNLLCTLQRCTRVTLQ